MSSKFFSGQTSTFRTQETLFFHFDISQKLKTSVFCFVERAEIGGKWRPIWLFDYYSSHSFPWPWIFPGTFARNEIPQPRPVDTEKSADSAKHFRKFCLAIFLVSLYLLKMDLLGSIMSSMSGPPKLSEQEKKRRQKEKEMKKKMEEKAREATKKMRESVEKKIGDFVKDDTKKCLEFPPMQKYERSIVHDVAEVTHLTFLLSKLQDKTAFMLTYVVANLQSENWIFLVFLQLIALFPTKAFFRHKNFATLVQMTFPYKSAGKKRKTCIWRAENGNACSLCACS